jgi:membrane protein DedA with SNARE-associated domain
MALHELLEPILLAISNVVATWSYGGVVALMAIESANIPLPSEAILPFAGYLVSKGEMNFHLAALAGAIGCVIGSYPSYLLGKLGGRPFLAKYGKYLLLSESDLNTAERWCAKYGDIVFFICRMLPVVRTFISFPAGVLQLHLGRFLAYTFVGSLLWSYLLVYVGTVFGKNLEAFKTIWHQFDLAIVLVVLGGLGYYIWHHLHKAKAHV